MSIAFRKILVCLIAVFALGAVAASAASAETAAEQQQFVPGFTGFACSETAGNHEYATFAACEELEGVETKGGKWHRHTTTFTSKSGVSTLAVNGATVICKKDTDKGELWGKESVANVVATFMECKGNNTKTGKECKVRSKGEPESSEQIVTNTLKGELGEVALAESATGVGLLLEGESPPVSVFVTLEGSCLPVTPSAVEGSVVGEVKPLAKGFNHELIFALNAAKEQKIKTFERSFALHCSNAPVTRKCEPDFSFKTGLKAFGLAATFESKDEILFSAEEEVLAGV